MDGYLALTPVLVFGIIGLIRFIGCNWVFGLDETTLTVQPAGDLTAVPGDRHVSLSWTYPSSGDATGFRITVSGGPFDPPPMLDASARSADVTGLTNGTLYSFSVVAERGTDASSPAIVEATPGVSSFVVDQPPIAGMERNNYTGWIGMEIMVGPNPINVTQLGRIVVASNSGVHVVKIVTPVSTPVTGQPVAGTDVVSINVMTVAQLDQSNVGTFAWAPLAQPVTLEANTIYFVVSSETNGGDLWLFQQALPTTGVAAVTFAISTFEGGPYAGMYKRDSPGQIFGPVSFRY